MKQSLSSFGHGSNAFCAHQFVHLAAIFHHNHALQVGAKFAIGCPQREAAIVTKGCRFSTGFTLSHFQFSPFVL